MKTFSGTFIFDRYEINLADGEVTFFYRVRDEEQEIAFQNQLKFPVAHVDIAALPREAFETTIKHLFILSGINYWKLWCPRTIEMKVALSQGEADFWNTVYTKGLGELFYKNNIDYRGLVNFPATSANAPAPTTLPRQQRSLLLVGGGKDSIVSAELMRQHEKPFTNFLLNPKPIQDAVVKLTGGDSIAMIRDLDHKLFQFNKQPGVFNGHVPISVFYSLTAVLAAILYDYRYVIASNERSASIGNIEYLGNVVNHQWSKSLEFEQLFSDFVHTYITPDITYFSLLRPWSEVKISSLFAKHPKYFSIFSSCNTNFAMRKAAPTKRWCGQCAKCAFVFLCLAAHLSRTDVLQVFGENFLDSPALQTTYRELLGLENTKPFDCVGTPEETALAFLLIRERGEFNNTMAVSLFIEHQTKFPDLESLKNEVLSPSTEHFIPQEFSDLLAAND